MRIELFLPPVALAFVVAGALCLVFYGWSRFFTRRWRAGTRHEGKTQISRFGGMALLLAFVGAVTLDEHLVLTREIVGLLVGGTFIALVGLWDDFHELSFKAQGFPIGSGAVESAARHVIQLRMKRPGMRWSTNGARAIAALRSRLRSHRPVAA